MDSAKQIMQSDIQDMSDKEYNMFLNRMLQQAESDAEAGQIKTMYDKIRAGGKAKAKGGKVRGYAYGTKKGGVKKMASCRGRKAMGNKD
jgi:hypothetical protein